MGQTDVIVMVPVKLIARFGFAYRALARCIAMARKLTGGTEAPVRRDARETALPATPAPGEVDPRTREILDQVAPLPWYHTIDLGHGVTTPGFVDHRPQVGLYGLPESMAGMRCLDVATFDGFWAFEMERRGASEVVAVDLRRWSEADIPKVLLPDAAGLGANAETGDSFRLAHGILKSRVRRETLNVYDLSPDAIGTFDVVLISDLLVHLRDPQLALERAFSVCHGSLILAESFDPTSEMFHELPMARFTGAIGSQTWWFPNTSTLKAMMQVAGFEPVEEVSRFVMGASSQDPIHKVVLQGFIPQRHSWRDLIDREIARQNHKTEPSEPSTAGRAGRDG